MRSWVWFFVSLSLAACGSEPASSQGGGAHVRGPAPGGEPTAAQPGERPASAVTSAEGILDRLVAARPIAPDRWDEETRRLLEPGRLEPLVGTTRDVLVRRLGEPNAADFNRDGQAGWSIGQVPATAPSHAPILVVELGADGRVSAARFQLSM